MHDVPTRQLIARCAVFLALAATPCRAADELRVPSASEQVQAAKLMQAALAASAAKPEDWRKLEETYAALVARYPRDATVLNARAEFLWEIGEQLRAVADWEQAERIDPKNPSILEHLGESALTLGDPRKAAAFFTRAVACDPGNSAGHFALANLWFLFRHELLEPTQTDEETLLNGALAHFSEAARLAPQNLDYARAYAETFYSLPKPDWSAALEAWRQVQRLMPEKDFGLCHLARVNLKMGHLDASRECLSKIQNPDYQQLRSRLQAQLEAAESSAPRSPSEPSLGATQRSP